MTDRLQPREAVVIDLDKVRGGAVDAGDAPPGKPSAGPVVDALVAALCEAEIAWAEGRFDDLGRLAAEIGPTGAALGLASFARVAGDLAGLAAGRDPVALAACLARLVRVGEASLAAIWDLEDLRL